MFSYIILLFVFFTHLDPNGAGSISLIETGPYKNTIGSDGIQGNLYINDEEEQTEGRTRKGIIRLPRTALSEGIKLQSYLHLINKELIWHVGVYSKLFHPYMQICGGTLITTQVIISAAHCFWNEVEGVLPAEQFAVAAGNVFRRWHDKRNFFRQEGGVTEIHIPARYRGSATSFQEDIALVLLSFEVETDLVVIPACVSFDDELDEMHTTNGSLGTVLGWGLTSAEGDPAKVLNYLELPAVDIQECMDQSDPAFLKYITVDKICAGVTTGKSLCRGDSGGGWVVRAGGAPYLRGVASAAARDGHQCNTHALAALTHVRRHRAFLGA